MTEPAPGDITPLGVDLIDSLLGEAAALAGQAHNLLYPVAQARNDLRKRLLDNGQIVTLDLHSPRPQISLAAVDGGLVKEQMYAADLMVAVGASHEGQTSIGGHPLAQRHWAQIIAHESENDRLLSAAMASLEVQVIAALEHDIRILDGSYGTPVIALATALAARSPRAAGAAADLITTEVLDAVTGLADPDRMTNPGVITALPKADSSHAFSDAYRDQFDLDLPSGDRFLAAEILRPGEMLYPRPAKELAGVHIAVRDDASPKVTRAAGALNYAVAPMGAAASQGRLLVTYVKPETTDTVVKIEARVSEPLTGAPGTPGMAVDELARLARIISDETIGPHMQEPFAQHMVDREAKKVSVAATTLRRAMLANLPEGSEEYVAWLNRSYRTR